MNVISNKDKEYQTIQTAKYLKQKICLDECRVMRYNVMREYVIRRGWYSGKKEQMLKVGKTRQTHLNGFFVQIIHSTTLSV